MTRDAQDRVRDLYEVLGGLVAEPRLTPGGWDLALGGDTVLELDEEFHFNRYRGVTLEAPWAAALPWTSGYRAFVVAGESRSGMGGKRWTNPSAERMFGPSDPSGVFGGVGSARWRQRALYDAMKDAHAASGALVLARVSIYDTVDGVTVNDVLYGRATIAEGAMARLVASRCSTA